MTGFKIIQNKYRHFLLLLIFLFLILWFEYLKKTIIPVHIMYSSIDAFIPFIKEFIIPYYFWFVYMAISLLYLGFVSKNDYYRLTAFLALNMSISYIIYILFPNAQFPRPRVPGNDIFSRLVRFIYSIDSTNNVCPSIHVANALAVHLVLTNCKKLKEKKLVRILSFFAMILISASTVFVKQHSIIDVGAGIVLALFIFLCIYKLPALFHANENVPVVSEPKEKIT